MPAEVARLQAAHPAEAASVVRDGRVLGQIAVTRALGDAMYKMPAVYVEKVRLSSFRIRLRCGPSIDDQPGLTRSRQIFARHGPSRIQAKLDRLLPLYLTPPYLSASPTVLFTPLSPASSTAAAAANGPTVLLLLCSDGLKDLYDRRPFAAKTLEDEWVRLAGLGLADRERRNAALCVLDDALGGEDVYRRSASLTLRLPDGSKFTDDTTVVIASW